LTEGLRFGAILAAFAVIFAIVGLSPSFRWVPEIPLLLVAGLIPAVILTVAGYRAGALSGALAGAIGGVVGGVAYVVYGKPVLNIPIGLVAGSAGGLALGALGEAVARRRR
jgi:hypothetical protein